jgi:hypothetical protein
MHELMAYKREFRAAEQTLARLQQRLEMMTGWRATLARETVERAQFVLDQVNVIHELSTMPRNFKRRHPTR